MILIFKTSIRNKRQVHQVANILGSLSGIIRWTLDLDDCDRVLRLEAAGIHAAEVEQLIGSAGFHCREMED